MLETETSCCGFLIEISKNQNYSTHILLLLKTLLLLFFFVCYSQSYSADPSATAYVTVTTAQPDILYSLRTTPYWWLKSSNVFVL